MDGFDDLLSQSRNVLDNPFEDPFAKPRSSSPDPWSSFGQASTLHDDAQNAFMDAHSATPTLDTHGFGDSSGFQYTVPETREETSTAEETHAETDQSGTHTPTSPVTPGFRESVQEIIEEVAPKREETPPPRSRQPSPPPIEPPRSPIEPPRSPIHPATAPATNNSFARNRGHKPMSSAAAPQPVYRPQPAYHTPLDQPASAGLGLERSIAGLAIGGESLGGWHGAQSAFAGVQPRPRSRARRDSDSSDDDRPILQSARLSANRVPAVQALAAPAQKDDNGLQPVFVITVDDPQKVGDPIRAYTMYTVHTKTTSPLYSKSTFSVLRRYSDFLWLYETLSQNNPGVVVPPVPEKNPYRRFDENFVQQRRLALEKCIQKIANHPVLQKDSDLLFFLESDTFALDIKHRKAELAQEKGGLMASLGQSIVGPRFYETDEWFDRQKSYLDSLETQLRGLVKAIDLVAKHRAELSAAAGEFAQTVADLSTSDVGASLASSFAGLAEVEREAQELQTIQSNEDVVTIMATADEYARLISSVRSAFSSRIRIYHNWQAADGHLRRTKQTHDTQRAQGKLPSDQLSRSLSLVADAERRALDAKQEFDQVSRLVKSEVARFEQERIEDFKNTLEAFLDGMISRQKQLIAAWENYQQRLLKAAVPPNERKREEPVASDASTSP
ncbi:Vps5-domain-containing protein [Wolfiporia cocos MD-104 SS10]|uniref:Vps5-domain-containing protein n=1 Tax=Wolfiporia cocos (strain MD-104) TaxID=742152 RepID=A0A2H3K2F5_WOLCO|nr:Vps5-domain-containing protein [Wolfiporia cocos MD-104 SS10]